MPTFDDPVTAATKASESLRALAHATRAFDDPSDLYRVIGDVLGGVRSLQQVLEQLAIAHDAHAPRARDDEGNVEAGARFVFTASSELFDAAKTLDQVESMLDAASQAAGRIAWQPAEEATAQRYISVVFLQGEEADHALRLLRTDGPSATVKYLAGWDYGDETTQAALSNGYVYDAPPVSQLDELRTVEQYTLITNPSYRYVSLLRSSSLAPDGGSDPVPIELSARSRSQAPRAEAAPATTTTNDLSSRRDRVQGSWFEHPGIAEVRRVRGLEL